MSFYNQASMWMQQNNALRDYLAMINSMQNQSYGEVSPYIQNMFGGMRQTFDRLGSEQAQNRMLGRQIRAQRQNALLGGGMGLAGAGINAGAGMYTAGIMADAMKGAGGMDPYQDLWNWMDS